MPAPSYGARHLLRTSPRGGKASTTVTSFPPRPNRTSTLPHHRRRRAARSTGAESGAQRTGCCESLPPRSTVCSSRPSTAVRCLCARRIAASGSHQPGGGGRRWSVESDKGPETRFFFFSRSSPSLAELLRILGQFNDRAITRLVARARARSYQPGKPDHASTLASRVSLAAGIAAALAVAENSWPSSSARGQLDLSTSLKLTEDLRWSPNLFSAHRVASEIFGFNFRSNGA